MNPTPNPQPESVRNHPASDQSPDYPVEDASQGSGIAADLKGGVGEVAHTARDAGNSFVREQQEKIADKIEGYGTAIEAACEKLASEGESESPLIRPANTASRQLHRASDYLHSHGIEDVVHDLSDLARRRPELVFGGLFVAGLASVRFLKASARRQPQTRRAFDRPRRGDGSDVSYARLNEEPPPYPGPERPFATAGQGPDNEFNNPQP